MRAEIYLSKGGGQMRPEIWKDKLILAVDDEPDILETIRELLSECPATLHTAGTFETARQLLISYSYDLVILDIMGVRGFDLLQIATARGLPAVMLTAHALSPEALKKSIELGARSYLPKGVLVSLVPFLEDVLKLSYQSAWKRSLDQLASLFDEKFGSNWRKSEDHFWKDFQEKLSVDEPTIIK
jgi:DNA-binding NtrC family response regulator